MSRDVEWLRMFESAIARSRVLAVCRAHPGTTKQLSSCVGVPEQDATPSVLRPACRGTRLVLSLAAGVMWPKPTARQRMNLSALRFPMVQDESARE